VKAILPVLVVSLALTGCAGLGKKTPELPEEAKAYGDALRWQKLPEAAARIPPREREDFLAEREEISDDLRIGDWEFERIDWAAPGRRASVLVKWTWHLDSRGLVHDTTSIQKWELHGQRWLMVGEVRKRGEPMPGVAEPREPTAAAAATASAPPTSTPTVDAPTAAASTER
jgi:hypothetical protein